MSEREETIKKFKELWRYGHPSFYDLVIKMCEIHEVKNKSYGIGNPLGNFMECERFDIPAWKGCLVRMCFDEETEILTSKGWKLFSDLKRNEKVASLVGDNLEWVNPLGIYSYDYIGRMYHLVTKSIDLKVTPEHRHLVKTRHSSWKFLQPEELKEKRSFRIRIGCHWKGKEPIFAFEKEPVLSNNFRYRSFQIKDKKAFMFFLGFWVAEGCTRSNTVVRLTQTNSDGRQKILGTLASLGINPNLSGKEIYFSNKSLVRFLKEFGIGARNKRIPKIIKESPTPLLKEFLSGYLLGDGWKGNTWCASTTSKRLADDLMEIGIKCHFAPKISRREGQIIKFPNQRQYQGKETYNLTFSTLLEPEIQKRRNPYEEWESYNGKVYCCSVQSGIILARRNGKPYWSGNSDKITRLYNLTAKLDNPEYKDAMQMESLEDTLMDLSCYSLLCLILLKERKKNV